MDNCIFGRFDMAKRDFEIQVVIYKNWITVNPDGIIIINILCSIADELHLIQKEILNENV
jgi:hypothetical protein